MEYEQCVVVTGFYCGSRVTRGEPSGELSMTCQELAARIERLQPGAIPRDVARLCLLMTNHVADLDVLADDRLLSTVWQQVGLRLQAAADQHSAVAAELCSLTSGADAVAASQIASLVRAIKVQNQILQLYVGRPAVG